MEYCYIVAVLIGMKYIQTAHAVCSAYSVDVSPDSKISSNSPETAKYPGVMLTDCLDYCLPNLEFTDCAVAYILNGAQSPEGPGECFYYADNCGGGCIIDSGTPSSVRVFKCTAIGVCLPPTNPSNGAVVVPDSTSIGTVATYSCNPTYQLSGSPTSTCGSDTLWSSPEPSCNFIDCGALPNPANGMVDTTSGTTYGIQATYSCNAGYNLQGTALTTCGTNGGWDTAEPSCVIVDCGTPAGVPANGIVTTASGTTYLQSTVYNCDIGYSLNGLSVRTCQAGGSWNGIAPSCSIVDCGLPVVPANGSIVTTQGTTYGSTVIHSCVYGFVLQGVTARTCQANGIWDGILPQCIEFRYLYCQSLIQNRREIKMEKFTTEMNQTFNHLETISGISKLTCARMCTDHLSELCDQPIACLLVKYDSTTRVCDMYNIDANGQNVTCSTTSGCHAFTDYDSFT